MKVQAVRCLKILAVLIFFTTGCTNGNLNSFNLTQNTGNQKIFQSFQMGNGGDITTFAMAIDAQSNFYIAGQTSMTFPSNTLYGGLGTEDAFVAKFNSYGTLQWTLLLGSAGSSTSATGMTLDSSGNIFIVGFTQAILGTLLGTHGTTDMFAAKFSSSGNLIWTSQQGISGASTNGAAIAIDSAGEIIIAGTTTGTLGGSSETGTRGSQDAVVTKLSPSGNAVIWTEQQGGGAGAQVSATALILDQMDNIFFVGNTTAALSSQCGAHGTQDAFVSKFNSSGVYAWTTQVGNSVGTVFSNNIVLDSANNIYFSGFSAGTIPGSNQYGTHGAEDLFISALSPVGICSWTSQLGGGGGSLSGGNNLLSINSENSLAVTGYTSGTVGTQYGRHGLYDGFLAQFTYAGAFQWSNQIGAAGANTYGKALVMDSNMNFFFTGQTDGMLENNFYGTHGSTDMVLIKGNQNGIL